MGRASQNGSIYKAKISKPLTAAYKPINLLHSVCQTATAERLLNALHTHPIIGPSNHFQPPFNKVAAIFLHMMLGLGTVRRQYVFLVVLNQLNPSCAVLPQRVHPPHTDVRLLQS